MCQEAIPCYFLLIEDDPGILTQVEMLREDFLADGMVFIAARSLGEAAEILNSRHCPDFEAIVIDPGLPDSRGIDTVYAVAALRPDTPRMVYTGFVDSKFVNLAFSHGVEEVLFKGEWTIRAAASLMRYAAGQWRAQRRLRKKCEVAEKMAERLQEIIDRMANPDIDRTVTGQLGQSLISIRDQAKILATQAA